MKYIVLSRTYIGCIQRVPIIFPDYLVHEQVAAAIKALPGMEKAVAVSAGFLQSICLDAEPTGNSESLKLGPGPDDALLITMHDYTHGL